MTSPSPRGPGDLKSGESSPLLCEGVGDAGRDSSLHALAEPDTWQATRDQLADAGIPPERILIAQLCTATDADMFCSYRRDGSPAGRMAAVIRPRGGIISSTRPV